MSEMRKFHSNLWRLPKAKRLDMFQGWTNQIHVERRQNCADLAKQYLNVTKEMQEVQMSKDVNVLRSASVVGFTVSGCAKYHTLLKALAPRIVLCEEAGEVLEAHLLAALSGSVEQLILIGDHQQLRPKVNEYSLSVDSARGFDFDKSLFERLVTEQEEKRARITAGEQQQDHEIPTLITLETQRRMHPSIANLVRETLYPRLQDHETVNAHPPVSGLRQRLVFFNHAHQEHQDDEKGGSMKSWRNKAEAQMVVELVRHFVRNGYRGDRIAILTPYVGQLLLLRELLRQNNMVLMWTELDKEELRAQGVELDPDENDSEEDEDDGGLIIPGGSTALPTPTQGKARKPTRAQSVKTNLNDCVRLATVDNFQGEEADLVIVSSVRCNPKGRTGFLKSDNRVNVMFSRAKHGMIVLGSARTVEIGARSSMFAKCVQLFRDAGALLNHIPLQCKRHPNKRINVSAPEHIKQLAAEGGCDEPCETKMKCGHVCRRLCHPDDINHEASKCGEPCARQLTPALCSEPGRHPCSKTCFEDCASCRDVLKGIRHPLCKHVIDMVCGEVAAIGLENVKCTAPQQIRNPVCDHEYNIPCWQARLIHPSRFKWEDGGVYDETIQRILSSCTQKCSFIHPECSHPCQRRCCDCMKSEAVQAGGFALRSNHGPCKHKCERPLLCHHLCQGVCHKAGDCPPCTQTCARRCGHANCNRPCNEVCYSCVYECDWKCTSQECMSQPDYAIQSCKLPCASPCIRLPCDRRCNRRMSCGHPCPLVCGERCQDPLEVCKECAILRDDNKLLDMEVDVVMSTPFRDHDATESPLVRLPCGHLLTIESMDGMLELSKFYRSRTVNGLQEWQSVVPFSEITASDQPAKAVCHVCKIPIRDVLRYGRIIKKLELDVSEKKFWVQTLTASEGLEKQIASVERRIAAVLNQVERGEQEVRQLHNKLEAVFREAKLPEPPSMELCNHAAQSFSNLELLPGGVPAQLRNEFKQTPQPQIRMLQTKLRCATSVLQLRTYLPRPEQKPKAKKAKGKGKANAAKAREPAEPSAAEVQAKLEAHLKDVCDYYEQTCLPIVRELLQICRASNSARSLTQSLILEAELAFAYLDCLAYFGEKKLAVRAIQKAVVAQVSEIVDRLRQSREFDVDPQQMDQLQQKLEPWKRRLSDTFYQDVSVEEKRAVFQAMVPDVGGGVGSFGGHWYTCPNGHVYTIANCGGAMMESKCPDCKAVVGGGSHRLRNDNSVATDFLREVQGPAPAANWRQEAANVFAIPDNLR